MNSHSPGLSHKCGEAGGPARSRNAPTVGAAWPGGIFPIAESFLKGGVFKTKNELDQVCPMCTHKMHFFNHDKL